MKPIFIFLTFLISIIIASESAAQENEPRYFSINYIQRLHFVNYQNFTNIQGAALPKLKDNSRFHGMRLEGEIANNILVGLYANGSLDDSKNANGYTSMGGGIGVATIEYRYQLPVNFFTSLGFGLGCGRFTYSSALKNGNKSVISNVDAIFGEPNIKIGYILKKKLILIFDASYMFVISSNKYNAGANNIPDVFPRGWFIGGSIGFQLSFINTKKKEKSKTTSAHLK